MCTVSRNLLCSLRLNLLVLHIDPPDLNAIVLHDLLDLLKLVAVAGNKTDHTYLLLFSRLSITFLISSFFFDFEEYSFRNSKNTQSSSPLTPDRDSLNRKRSTPRSSSEESIFPRLVSMNLI